MGPSRKRGMKGCWHRLGSLCHEDAAGFEVAWVGEAVGGAPQHLEQVVGSYLEGLVLLWLGAWVSEVCLSLPWSWGVESNLSFGFFGVVEMGSAVVVEPGLAGLL